MQLISTLTLIRLISLFHLTTSYFFLVAPQKLAEQGLVMLMGQAMDIPPSSTFFKPSESNALLALIIGFLGLIDLVAASMDTIAAIEYWSSQAPVRVLALFGVTAWTYLKGSGTMAVVTRSPASLLHTDLVFTIGFFELCLWFWVFVSLREDRKVLAQKLAERRKFEQDNQL